MGGRIRAIDPDYEKLMMYPGDKKILADSQKRLSEAKAKKVKEKLDRKKAEDQKRRDDHASCDTDWVTIRELVGKVNDSRGQHYTWALGHLLERKERQFLRCRLCAPGRKLQIQI